MSEPWVTIKISRKLASQLEELRGTVKLDTYVEDILKKHVKETNRYIHDTIREIRGEKRGKRK